MKVNYSQSRDYYYKYKALKYYLKNNYIEKQKQIKGGRERLDQNSYLILLFIKQYYRAKETFSNDIDNMLETVLKEKIYAKYLYNIIFELIPDFNDIQKYIKENYDNDYEYKKIQMNFDADPFDETETETKINENFFNDMNKIYDKLKISISNDDLIFLINNIKTFINIYQKISISNNDLIAKVTVMDMVDKDTLMKILVNEKMKETYLKENETRINEQFKEEINKMINLDNIQKFYEILKKVENLNDDDHKA